MDRKWFHTMDYCFFALAIFSIRFLAKVLSFVRLVVVVSCVATQFSPHAYRFSIERVLRMWYANLNRSNQKMHNFRRFKVPEPVLHPYSSMDDRPITNVISHRINDNDFVLESDAEKNVYAL